VIGGARLPTAKIPSVNPTDGTVLSNRKRFHDAHAEPRVEFAFQDRRRSSADGFTGMWYEDHQQFVRAPVPPSFDRLVDKLQNGDSVLFESISLPLLASFPDDKPKTGRPQTALTPRGDSIPDLSDDFMSDDEPEKPHATSAELQLRALLDRVHELEASNQRKDEEIARLQNKLHSRKGSRSSDSNGSADAEFYKTQYERMKAQYEKLKEVVAPDGKGKRGKRRSAGGLKRSA
jgi:hypothetical protein